MAERRFTDLELERSLAGDLSPDRARALDTQATDADRARLAELRTEHAAYLDTVDVDAEVHRIEQRVARAQPAVRPGWRRWLAPMGALAAAAAIVIVLVNRRTPTHDDDELRTKGDGVTLVIHTPNARLSTGDPIAPGAKIRFEAQGTTAGYVAVVGIDGAGTTTVYYPFGATAPAPIGLDRMLPGAIQLDATPGDEKFFALFSTHSFAIDNAASALRSGGPLPDGVSSSEVVLHKH